MNDTELDDMLNEWKSPEPSEELRRRIGAVQPPRRWRFSWPTWHLGKGLLTGVAAGAAICLLGIAAAFPQALGPSSVRFHLISEFVDHNDDGSSRVTEQRDSTAQRGNEIVLSRETPGSLLMTIHNRIFTAIHRWLGLEHTTAVAADCSVQGSSIARGESVLNYNTVVLRFDDTSDGRYTEWRAPGLDCIVLKSTWEKRLADGTFRLSEERRPLAITVSR